MKISSQIGRQSVPHLPWHLNSLPGPPILPPHSGHTQFTIPDKTSLPCLIALCLTSSISPSLSRVHRPCIDLRSSRQIAEEESGLEMRLIGQKLASPCSDDRKVKVHSGFHALATSPPQRQALRASDCFCRNARSSWLITSACVVHSPCGAPGTTLSVPFLTSFTLSLPESSMGTI